jgi:hypothetical protein
MISTEMEASKGGPHTDWAAKLGANVNFSCWNIAFVLITGTRGYCPNAKKDFKSFFSGLDVNAPCRRFNVSPTPGDI